MEPVISTISVDVSQTTPAGIISAKQNDVESRSIEITIFNGGVLYDIPGSTTALLRLTKPDGTTVLMEGIIDGSTVTVDLTAQALTAAGIAKADISISDGAGILSTNVFYIIIAAAAYDENALRSNAEISLLSQALLDLQLQYQDAIDEIEAATAAANAAAMENQTDILTTLATENPFSSFTAKNIVKYPDFTTDVNGWTAVSATIAASGGKMIQTGTGASGTVYAYTNKTGTYKQLADNTFVTGDKIFVHLKAKVNNALCLSLRFALFQNASFGSTVIQMAPVNGVEYTYSGIVTAGTLASGYSSVYLYTYYTNGTDANGATSSWDDIIVVNLTTIFGAGNEPTLAQFEQYLKDSHSNVVTIGTTNEIIPIYDYQRNKLWMKDATTNRMSLKTVESLPIADANSLFDATNIGGALDETMTVANGAVNSAETANVSIAGAITQGKNLFNCNIYTDSKYPSATTGVLTTGANYIASEFIKCTAGLNYTENYGAYLCFYDVNQTFISGTAYSGTARTTTAPTGAVYMRLGVNKTSRYYYQIEQASTATPFENYKQNVVYPGGFTPFLNLPLTIPAIVGKEVNIYFENIFSLKASEYDWNVTISPTMTGATQQTERLNMIPTTAGSYAVTIEVYKSSELVATGSTTVAVKAANVGGSNTKKLIVIGDSTTDSGTVVGELATLFGIDNMDLTLLGTRGTNPNYHEGRSGWSTTQYTTLATSGGMENAFWNGSAFNFSDYVTAQGYSGIDYVAIALGINDSFSYAEDGVLMTAIPYIVSRFTTMANSIKAYNGGSVKLGIALPLPPSLSEDSFGKDYGTAQTRWRCKRNNAKLTQALLTAFGAREAEGIYIIPIHLNLDTVNNFTTETVAVNSRNSTTITRPSSGVHPAASGYYQMADTYYYWIKGFET